MIHRLPVILGIALAATLPAAAAAPGPPAQAWTVDHAGSSLGYMAATESEAFMGIFGKWDADIAFDPANLAGSHVAVTIDMSSSDSGDANRDTPLLDNNWFAVSMFPTASFETDSITAEGNGAYVADGTLTIRGHAEKISLPFTLAIDGNTATMDGSVMIDRSKWELGKGAWQDHSVMNDVQVKVSLKATKAG
jgi:polyisoprenoid-binding protein YceI